MRAFFSEEALRRRNSSSLFLAFFLSALSRRDIENSWSAFAKSRQERNRNYVDGFESSSVFRLPRQLRHSHLWRKGRPRRGRRPFYGALGTRACIVTRRSRPAWTRWRSAVINNTYSNSPGAGWLQSVWPSFRPSVVSVSPVAREIEAITGIESQAQCLSQKASWNIKRHYKSSRDLRKSFWM